MRAALFPQLSPATVSTSRLANVSFDMWAEAGIREENNFITLLSFLLGNGRRLLRCDRNWARAPPRTLWLR